MPVTVTPSNVLLLVRVMSVPVIAGLFFVPDLWARWSIFALFSLAVLTDLLDGWLARLLNQESLFGKVFDPVADKLLVVITLFLMGSSGLIVELNLLAAGLIITREIMISGLREYLSIAGKSLPVTRFAKWKTFLQMGAIALLLLENTHSNQWWPDISSTVLLWCAALATLASGWQYARRGWCLIAETES